MNRWCRRNRERLPEYAEGGLTPPVRAQVERHLAACRRCRTELRDVTLVIGALRAVEPEPLPDNLVPRVSYAVHQAVLPHPTGRPVWARLAVPVALATALIAAAFALRGGAPRLSPSLRAPGTQALEAGGGLRQAAVPARGGMVQADRSAVAPAPVVTRRRTVAQAPSSLNAPIAPSVTGPPGLPGGEPEPQAAPTERKGSVQEVTGAESASALARPRARPEAERGFVRGSGTPKVPWGPAGKGLGWYPYRSKPEAPGTSAARAGPALAASEVRADAGPSPAVSARASVTRQQGRPAVGLRFAAEESSGRMKVSIGSGEKTRVIWQDARPQPGEIVISGEHVGPGPTTVPITVELQGGIRKYMLFLPTISRLGESAPSTPRAYYDGQPLAKVLADFSALTGLVLLAEGPLDRPVVGELPQGSPDTALAVLAANAGLQVAREDRIVRSLTPRPE